MPDSLPPDVGALDASDPYARQLQTFPELSPDQVERIRAFGDEVTLQDGEPLFRRGERRVPFFLVLSGRVDIFDSIDGERRRITTHHANQFTGELDLFNDRKILVSGCAGGETKVLRLDRLTFQRMMTAEPDIGEIITRAFVLRRTGLIRHAQGGVTLVGDRHAAETLDIARFLRRNGYPLEVVDPDAHDGELPPRCQHPAVLLPDGQVLSAPTRTELADELGLSEEIEFGHVHDVAVVGAGPAGLASAVYAASEGLDTVVIEGLAPGGQAGTSSRIENYLGFPTGISGQALAGRAQVQAQKFGARLVVSRPVERLCCECAGVFRLVLEGGAEVLARSVVVATGATYRRLPLENFERFERRGLHYAATAIEADLCQHEEIAVVGGGNSAGQAAVFLAQYAEKVHMLVRGETLASSMSDYLISRLEAGRNIQLHFETEVDTLHGEDFLEEVTLKTRRGARSRRPIRNVFVMIGAQPNTAWLEDCVELDEKGFVKTPGVGGILFGTSRPGVVAVGDVQSGSVKRVASAVGQGSVVISGLHRFLSGAAT